MGPVKSANIGMTDYSITILEFKGRERKDHVPWTDLIGIVENKRSLDQILTVQLGVGVLCNCTTLHRSMGCPKPLEAAFGQYRLKLIK